MDKPTRIVVGSLVGVSQKDAREIARGLAERLFDAPKASFIRIKKHADRVIYELQECNGYSYLEPTLERLEGGKEAWIALKGDRVAQVAEEEGELVTVIHGEGKVDEVRDEIIDPKLAEKKMTPMTGDAREILLAGKIVATTGAALFLAAVAIAGATNALAPKIPEPRVTFQLPAEWLNERQLGVGEYIEKLLFANGEYSSKVGRVGAQAAQEEPEAAPEGEKLAAVEPLSADGAAAEDE